MATYSSNEWKSGLKVILEGDPCSILENVCAGLAVGPSLAAVLQHDDRVEV